LHVSQCDGRKQQQVEGVIRLFTHCPQI